MSGARVGALDQSTQSVNPTASVSPKEESATTMTPSAVNNTSVPAGSLSLSSTIEPIRGDVGSQPTKSIMLGSPSTFPVVASGLGAPKGTIDDIIKATGTSSPSVVSITSPTVNPGNTVNPGHTINTTTPLTVGTGVGANNSTFHIHKPIPLKPSLLSKLPPIATTDLLSSIPSGNHSGGSSVTSSPYPHNESNADLVRRRSVISFTEPTNHERLHRVASIAKQHYQQQQHPPLSGAASAISASAANYKTTNKRISSPSPASSSGHTSPANSRQGSIVRNGALVGGGNENVPITTMPVTSGVEGSENSASSTPEFLSPVSPNTAITVTDGNDSGVVPGDLTLAPNNLTSIPSLVSNTRSNSVPGSIPSAVVIATAPSPPPTAKANATAKATTTLSSTPSSSSLGSDNNGIQTEAPNIVIPATIAAPATVTPTATSTTATPNTATPKSTSSIVNEGATRPEKSAAVNNPSQNVLSTKSTASEVFSSSSSLSDDSQKVHILLAVTGSVASIKIGLIIAKFQQIYGIHGVEIQLIVTKSAEHFIQQIKTKIPPSVKIWKDENEWATWKGRTDKVLHVELRRWADILLVAPLSANSLAKIANGICDNLLTSVVRCWNPTTPILVAPAMNTFMYTNPMTKKHLNIIKEEFPWIEVLRPIEKVLVCGDIGMGGMREWSDIVETVVTRLGGPDEEDDDDNDDDDDDDDDDNDDNEDNTDNDEDEDNTDNDEDEDNTDNDEDYKDPENIDVKSIPSS